MQKLKIVGWFLAFLVLIVGVRLSTASFRDINTSEDLYIGGEYPFQLRIKPSKTEYKKSEYVVVDVVASNVGDFDITIIGRCKGDLDVVVNWQDRLINSPRASLPCLDTGYIQIESGKSAHIATLELDMSRYDNGKHKLTAIYEYLDPVGIQQARSNEIEIELQHFDNIAGNGCYTFDSYATSFCDQIMIRTTSNLTAEKNNEICKNIKENYVDKHHPTPSAIRGLSVGSCAKGKPAVFVFNVPRGNSDIYEARISEAKKSERICWSTRYSLEWINDKTFLNNSWNGCSY